MVYYSSLVYALPLCRGILNHMESSLQAETWWNLTMRPLSSATVRSHLCLAGPTCWLPQSLGHSSSLFIGEVMLYCVVHLYRKLALPVYTMEEGD